MKFNKIILFFNLSLIFGVIMRFFQIKFTIQYATGFFVSNLSGYGYFMLAVVFLIAILCGIFASTYYINPETPPKKGIVLGVASFLPAISILYEIFTESKTLDVIPLQSVALKILGILAAAYFILYGLSKFVEITLPDMTAAIPVLYIIIRIICDFAAISSLAIISDYIYLICGYCLILLFFMNFLKLYNKVDTEYNFRKIFATGLSAAVICISQSVAHIAVNLVSNNGYTHISHGANLSLLAFGIFIIAFIFTHFSKENTKE